LTPVGKRADSRTPHAGAAATWLREDDDGVLILVHLQPGARRTGSAGDYNGRLKIAVAAPPLEGRANDSLCEWLADRLGVPVRRVRIVSGRHSRDKAVRIDGVDVDRVRRLLAQK
jgi:hypothetical protein